MDENPTEMECCSDGFGQLHVRQGAKSNNFEAKKQASVIVEIAAEQKIQLLRHGGIKKLAKWEDYKAENQKSKIFASKIIGQQRVISAHLSQARILTPHML